MTKNIFKKLQTKLKPSSKVTEPLGPQFIDRSKGPPKAPSGWRVRWRQEENAYSFYNPYNEVEFWTMPTRPARPSDCYKYPKPEYIKVDKELNKMNLYLAVVWPYDEVFMNFAALQKEV